MSTAAPAREWARPFWDFNHVIAYGQSYASGFEGWPALSLTPRHGSLMLGGSVRPVHEAHARWRPVPGADGQDFQPLVATVQDPRTGRLLCAEEVAALPPGDMAMGETVLEGALNAWGDRRAMPGQDAPLLGSTCAVGGRTLEALSKGADPELFNRLRDCATLARDAAARAGGSYGITALLLLQGENNVAELHGGTADRAEYLALMARLDADFQAEVAAGIAGQHSAPMMFIYQTGGNYVRDSLSVQMAQLDAALSMPGCVMAAPCYPVTTKIGHLDANGYRWLGAQFGKVLHRVLDRGETWLPLHPRAIALGGVTVTVDFHVPVPPLQWGRPCAGHAMLGFHDKGFSIVDSAGPVPIAAVDLSGDTGVVITLRRPPEGPALLRYGDRQHRGRGCLHDSDPETGDVYSYDAAAGHYPSADIPELTAHPYPLHNWCVLFSRTLPDDGGVALPDAPGPA